MSATYDLSIFMEPCLVTKLIATTFDKVEYTIGASSVTSQQYTFTQVPQCNYKQNYFVTGLMPFFDHQTSQRNFIVTQSLDLSLEGVYDVTVRAEIIVPTDYTQNSSITISE